MFHIKKITLTIIITTFLLTMTSVNAVKTSDIQMTDDPDITDYDPYVDIGVTVTIKAIRAFDKIDLLSDPDFYVKVFINGNEYQSPIWRNMKYVESPNWSATCNVPDDVEEVDIRIQLWDWNLGVDTLCDISKNYGELQFVNDSDIELTYHIGYGLWDGEDYAFFEPIMFDPSGYGRLNGCDDNSIYDRDKDCELIFDITQNDIDGDGVPAFVEEYYYGTDPIFTDNRGEDADHDGIPLEWEHRWGYDPFYHDDHENLDPDQDGLDNVEEYLTSQWGSDPFRKDLFIELDQMEDSPDGIKSILPERSKQLLRDAYHKHNIVYHLDDGCMGGGDMIPFDNSTTREELMEIYYDYFLHGDINNWRRGVFHYGIVVYDAGWAGYVFWNGYTPYLDSFQISSKWHEDLYINKNYLYNVLRQRTLSKDRHREKVLAGVYMHETGHTLGIFHGNTPGCDDKAGVFPYHKNWWKWRPYKSVMNYRYVYSGIIDYSDGSRGKNDFNDWGNIDLTFFQREIWWNH